MEPTARPLVSFPDTRGFVRELWRGPFAQVNHTRSVHRVLRGLHLQLEKPQGKLVTVVRGAIWDVAVDVRRTSPTFGRWWAFELAESTQAWVPPGFAHGFQVLSDEADVIYALTDVYAPDTEVAIRWDDPTLAIPWPLDPILSPRDAAAPLLAAARLPA